MEIPQIWKIANVTPLHKKGSKNDVKNYHPISLTSILCKIMEKKIRDKISNTWKKTYFIHQTITSMVLEKKVLCYSVIRNTK